MFGLFRKSTGLKIQLDKTTRNYQVLEHLNVLYVGSKENCENYVAYHVENQG